MRRSANSQPQPRRRAPALSETPSARTTRDLLQASTRTLTEIWHRPRTNQVRQGWWSWCRCTADHHRDEDRGGRDRPGLPGWRLPTLERARVVSSAAVRREAITADRDLPRPLVLPAVGSWPQPEGRRRERGGGCDRPRREGKRNAGRSARRAPSGRQSPLLEQELAITAPQQARVMEESGARERRSRRARSTCWFEFEVPSLAADIAPHASALAQRMRRVRRRRSRARMGSPNTRSTAWRHDARSTTPSATSPRHERHSPQSDAVIAEARRCSARQKVVAPFDGVRRAPPARPPRPGRRRRAPMPVLRFADLARVEAERCVPASDVAHLDARRNRPGHGEGTRGCRWPATVIATLVAVDATTSSARVRLALRPSALGPRPSSSPASHQPSDRGPPSPIMSRRRRSRRPRHALDAVTSQQLHALSSCPAGGGTTREVKLRAPSAA